MKMIQVRIIDTNFTRNNSVRSEGAICSYFEKDTFYIFEIANIEEIVFKNSKLLTITLKTGTKISAYLDLCIKENIEVWNNFTRFILMDFGDNREKFFEIVLTTSRRTISEASKLDSILNSSVQEYKDNPHFGNLKDLDDKLNKNFDIIE